MAESILFFLLFLFYSIVIMLSATLSPEELRWIGCLLIATTIPFHILRPILAFAVLVAEILCFGLTLNVMGFLYSWQTMQQIIALEKLALYTSAAGILWIIAIVTRNLEKQNRDNAAKLNRLKKYEKEAGLLTFSEFVYQAELIHTAMRRRSETGYLIKLTLSPGEKSYAIKTFFGFVSRTALRSVRNRYDIVGKVSEIELLILLQNTQIEGSQIVLDRFRNNLSRTIRIPQHLYNVEICSIPETWQETYQLIKEAAGGLSPK